MVFMILVQFKLCTPSVYLMSQELYKEGKILIKHGEADRGRIREGDGGRGEREAHSSQSLVESSWAMGMTVTMATFLL